MVKHPEMRRELIFHVRSLADPAYQQQVWIEGEQPNEDAFYSIDDTIAVLFDDMRLDIEPEKQVGLSLENAGEVEALRPLIRLLDGLLTEHGIVPLDDELFRSAEWLEVIAAARQAHQVLEPNRDSEGLFREMQEGFFDEQFDE